MDGTRVSLNAYRGKPLVVVFWAGWSKKSAEQMSAIKDIARSYADQVGVLGVNVIDSVESTKSEAATRGYTWDQVVLSGPDRAKVTAQFEVESLPSIALVNRNGQVVARNLEGEALRAAVQRALKQ